MLTLSEAEIWYLYDAGRRICLRSACILMPITMWPSYSGKCQKVKLLCCVIGKVKEKYQSLETIFQLTQNECWCHTCHHACFTYLWLCSVFNTVHHWYYTHSQTKTSTETIRIFITTVCWQLDNKSPVFCWINAFFLPRNPCAALWNLFYRHS